MTRNQMGGIKIAIDRGGTFTDCIGNPGTGKQEDDVIIKLLSVDPQNYSDSNLEGIRRLLEKLTGETQERGKTLDTSKIESLRLGTTVATNALLEKKGSRCALVTTKGFKDLLNIGNQSRPNIFDLSVSKPDVLFESVVEIDERVTLENFTEDPDKIFTAPTGDDLVKGLSSETVRILKRPNVEEIKSTLNILFASGIRSIAVCLLHSYTFPDHEKIVGEIAQNIGFTHISLSSQLSPMIKSVSRANSAVVDAYLTPEIKNYLKSFEKGLKNGIFSEASPNGIKCHFMQSDGGLVDATAFTGLKAILSGPAGGVVGYSKTCYDSANKIPLIGFDMGGTSTDVSRFGDGRLDHVLETTTAGVTIQSPQLDINTVAAGGGSILSFRNGLMQVGPESASSHPGPACYRKGGPLTVTDANLMLGRLVPEYFPKIFGPNENEGLDFEATQKKFAELTHEINAAHPNSNPMTPYQVAYGFLQIANETMSRPIRQLTESKGHVLADHRLVSFGGAGGQCASSVAQILGIDTVLIHKYSSILSAYGMALADVVEDIQEPASYILNKKDEDLYIARFNSLKATALKSLSKQGFKEEDIELEYYLNMRYVGTESSIMVRKGDSWDFQETFYHLHEKEFGFYFEKDIIIDDIRIRAIGKTDITLQSSTDDQIKLLNDNNLIKDVSEDKVEFFKDCFWETDFKKTAVYRLENLEIGTNVIGPAIIADDTQTNVVPPNATALVLKTHVVITLKNKFKKVENSDNVIKINPVLLSIFGHRFTDIADQMGVSLQKTSVSVNVKERLDFSCALFDAAGNLVANAPHVPVHLGSMSTCIKAQMKIWKDKLKEGDVLVTNHPSTGGTHLPDITVITPVFEKGEIVFITASRAHHADIGGILPGSMPPLSTELWQEGAAFYSELLVTDGVFQDDMLKRILVDIPSQYEGCSGSRRLSDNISDIKAQIAANRKGISLIENLIAEFGIDSTLLYMKAIQSNAAATVSLMLKNIIGEEDDHVLACRDFMDDGSCIDLQIYYDKEDDKVVFDFTNSSPQAYNNFNAPVAITYSAIIYVLRCMIDEDIPLNQGCLDPIKVKVSDGSILCPDDFCAVVGGNVCTSQRITDTILKAFNYMADSQGCCNNFTFGKGGKDANGVNIEGFGYYETIAGGHGASSKWNGVSGVHTNMTNTRITDAEVLEKRYPVLLTEFSINHGTGGNGQFKGGNGVIREIEFREKVSASILSERRVVAPHGLNGGEDGQKGLNIWIKNIKDSDGNVIDQKIVNIGGRNTVNVDIGEKIRIQTPGGGGYGVPTDTNTAVPQKKKVINGFAGGSLMNRKKEQYEN